VITLRQQALRAAVITAVSVGALAVQATPSSAGWAPVLGGSSVGLAAAGVLPPPTNPVSTCNGGVGTDRTKVRVSWTAAPYNTSYTILQSASSGGAPYTSVGTTTGTTWTSASLPSGSYTFRIEGVRSGWKSVPSAATATRTISQSLLVNECT
jgi:hypothetical protein